MIVTTGYCGIDAGTQGARAVIIDAEGRVLGSGSRPLVSSRREGARHEQQADDWWSAVAAATRTAVDTAGPDVQILAAALDATSGTVLVEDRDGRACGPALMYDDARAAAQASAAATVGEALWRALGYAMQPTWALPKAMWLIDQEAVPAGGRIAHQSDHLVRRLTGIPVATDTSNALKTGADLRDATWPAALLTDLGLDTSVLPDLVLPGTVLGTVTADAAAATGLPSGVPVRAGMTDGCAAQIAAGALAPGSWSSALGTTLVVKGSTTDLLHDPTGAVYCHRHPDGGWLPGGASSSGAGVIRATFGPDADLSALTRAAAAMPPVAGASYPLAGRGERFPFVAREAHGFLTPSATDDAARFAALCQAISHVERLAYDVLGLLGADVSGPVALTGGATANGWWNQLRTDMLGRPTSRPASAQAAVGMAVLAAAEPGALTVTAARMIRVAERFEPDPQRHAELSDGYATLVGELAQRGWLDAALAAQITDRVTAVTR